VNDHEKERLYELLAKVLYAEFERGFWRGYSVASDERDGAAAAELQKIRAKRLAAVDNS